MNGLVDDLEKVAHEIFEIQSKLNSSGLNSGEEIERIGRQLNDLEAHLNTSIITEKSVRKTSDKNLAEELDKIIQKLTSVESGAGKLAIGSGEGYQSNKTTE